MEGFSDADKLSLMVATAQLIVTFLFSILFYQEWRKQKRSKNEQFIPLALTLFFAFLFVGSLMTTYSNFFAGDTLLTLLENTRIYFRFVVGFIIVVGGIIIFIAERIVRMNLHLNTRYLFLIYYLTMTITLSILITLGVEVFFGANFIFSIPLIVLIGLFIYTLLKKTSGKIRKRMILVILGFGLFDMMVVQEIWYLLRSDFDVVFGLKNVVLIASILTGFGFYTIPSFTEFDWNKKIRQLYILDPNGLCLFQQTIRSESVADKDLLGGSLMAVQSLMKEMIQSDQSLQVIDHGDAKIIFEQSFHAVAIMIADEDLYVIHMKLQQLLKEFEALFGNLMYKWSGNLDLFKPLQPVANKIFELKSEVISPNQ